MTQDHAPAVVLVSFHGEPSEELREAFGVGQALTDHSPWIFVSRRSPREVAQLLLGLHGDESLRPSGAVLSALPPSEGLWVAYEWGALAVEATLLDALGEDRAGWEIRLPYDPAHLLILEPSERRPPPRGGPRPRQPRHVSTPDEFAAEIFRARAATTYARAQHVHAKPERWFGRLAEPTVGGAVALLMTAPKASGDEECLLLHTPAALGLEVGEPAAGLDRVARPSGLTVRAWGISYAGPGSAADILLGEEPQLDRDALGRAVTGHIQPSGCAYAVVAVMHAPVDPTVHLAAGAVFEQDAVRDEQNLILAAPMTVAVPLGQFIPVILPAWCMNSGLAAPSGSAMRPTALSMPEVPTTQHEVWRRIDGATGRWE